MNLINRYDKGNINGRDIVIYDIEGMDNGVSSAIEIIKILKSIVPIIGYITVKPFSDHSNPKETFYYDSYDDFFVNQKDFINQEVDTISIFGNRTDLNYIGVTIGLEYKTIGFSAKHLAIAVALAEKLGNSLTNLNY